MPINPKPTQEVREKLKSDEGVQELYGYSESIFKFLDAIHFDIKSRKVIDGEMADLKLDKLVGYRGFLNPILEALEAEMDGNANVYSVNKKHSMESEGKKPIATFVDKEASLSVQSLRVLRNQLRGYINQIDIDIMVLMGKQKYYLGREREGK
jgi:hypothetical protein